MRALALASLLSVALCGCSPPTSTTAQSETPKPAATTAPAVAPPAQTQPPPSMLAEPPSQQGDYRPDPDMSAGSMSPAGGAAKTVQVKGYYTKEGKWVQPHARSAPGSGSRPRKK